MYEGGYGFNYLLTRLGQVEKGFITIQNFPLLHQHTYTHPISFSFKSHPNQSSGQDKALSLPRHGFNSRIGNFFFFSKILPKLRGRWEYMVLLPPLSIPPSKTFLLESTIQVLQRCFSYLFYLSSNTLSLSTIYQFSPPLLPNYLYTMDFMNSSQDFVAKWLLRMIRNHLSSEARVRITSKSLFFVLFFVPRRVLFWHSRGYFEIFLDNHTFPTQPTYISW